MTLRIGNLNPYPSRSRTLLFLKCLGGKGTISFDALNSHDFQLTRDIGDKAKVLSAGISAFNMFNHANYQKYIGTLSSSRFGRGLQRCPGAKFNFPSGIDFESFPVIGEGRKIS